MKLVAVTIKFVSPTGSNGFRSAEAGRSGEMTTGESGSVTKPQNSQTLAFGVFVGTVIGIGGTIFGYNEATTWFRLRWWGADTSGRVIICTYVAGGDEYSNSYKIDYAFSADKDSRQRIGTTTFDEKLPAGTAIAVRYLPSDPEIFRATKDSGLATPFGALSMLVICAPIGAAGIGYFIFAAVERLRRKPVAER